MKFSVLLVCLAIFSGTVTAQPINDAVDDMLNEIRKSTVNDTIELEDGALFDFEREIGFIKTSGQASFKNTKLTNVIKSIRREKDAVISWPDNRLVQIKIPLATGPMKFVSTGRIQIMGVGPRREYEGVIKYASLTAVISFNQTSDALKVRSVNTKELTGVTLKAKGPGLIAGPLIRRVVYNRAIELFKPLFTKQINKMFKEALELQVPDWLEIKDLLRSED